MTIGYNSSIDLARSAVLSEVWFGKGFGSGMYSTYDIVYKVEWTEAGKYPIFRNLIQYNRFDPGELAVPDWSRVPESVGVPIEHSGWIGEYFSSPDLNISKFIFPKFLVEHGYVTAVLFDNIPSDERWLNRKSDSIDWWIETFNSKWRYKISLDKSYEVTPESGTPYRVERDYDIDEDGNYIVKTDFIVQLLTTEDVGDDNTLNLDNAFIKVHNSNYTNPHSTQISSIATQDLDGHIMSTERANQTIALPNSFMVGSFMVSNDFSMRFMGEQLYLPRPTDLGIKLYELVDGILKDKTDEIPTTDFPRSTQLYVALNVYPMQELATGIERSVAIDNRVTYAITYTLDGGGPSTDLTYTMTPVDYSVFKKENLYKLELSDGDMNKTYRVTISANSLLYNDIDAQTTFTSKGSNTEGVGTNPGQNGGG